MRSHSHRQVVLLVNCWQKTRNRLAPVSYTRIGITRMEQALCLLCLLFVAFSFGGWRTPLTAVSKTSFTFGYHSNTCKSTLTTWNTQLINVKKVLHNITLLLLGRSTNQLCWFFSLQEWTSIYVYIKQFQPTNPLPQ